MYTARTRAMQPDSAPVDRPRTSTKHVVQLFDSRETLVDGVARFFAGALAGDAQMLAVMDHERWNSVAMRLASRGSPVDDALRSGRLIVRSATEMLSTFMVDGAPRRELFRASVGRLIARLCESPGGCSLYGEMVDVLAAQGQYAAACELEELWSELGRQHTFTLRCGYISGNFGDPRNDADLRRICASHDRVHTAPADVLGSFLVRRMAKEG